MKLYTEKEMGMVKRFAVRIALIFVIVAMQTSLFPAFAFATDDVEDAVWETLPDDTEYVDWDDMDDWDYVDTDTCPLYLCGEELCDSNSSGDGWSYDVDTNTLTLDGFNYFGTGVFTLHDADGGEEWEYEEDEEWEYEEDDDWEYDDEDDWEYDDDEDWEEDDDEYWEEDEDWEEEDDEDWDDGNDTGEEEIVDAVIYTEGSFNLRLKGSNRITTIIGEAIRSNGYSVVYENHGKVDFFDGNGTRTGGWQQDTGNEDDPADIEDDTDPDPDQDDNDDDNDIDDETDDDVVSDVIFPEKITIGVGESKELTVKLVGGRNCLTNIEWGIQGGGRLEQRVNGMGSYWGALSSETITGLAEGTAYLFTTVKVYDSNKKFIKDFKVTTTVKVVDKGAIHECRHNGSVSIKGAVEATCTKEGSTGSVYCNICNKELSKSKVIPKKQHEYTSSVIRTATCVKTGCVRHTCKVCKSSYDEETPVDPSNHTRIVTASGKEATYESEGLTTGEMCKDCKKVLKEQTVIPRLEREDPDADPDPDVNDDVVSDVIFPEIITLGVGESKELTVGLVGGKNCLTNIMWGRQTNECFVCRVNGLGSYSGELSSETITGLTEGTGYLFTTIRVYDRDKNFVKEFSVHTTVRVVDKGAIPECRHDGSVRVQGAAEATCEKEGATGSVYCNICNKELSKSKVIPKKQHEITSTVIRTANCVKTGCVRHTCKLCKSSYDEEIPIDPSNHTNVVTVSGKEATYESEGLTKGEMCKDCGKVLKEQTVIPRLEREDPGTESDPDVSDDVVSDVIFPEIITIGVGESKELTVKLVGGKNCLTNISWGIQGCGCLEYRINGMGSYWGALSSETITGLAEGTAYLFNTIRVYDSDKNFVKEFNVHTTVKVVDKGEIPECKHDGSVSVKGAVEATCEKEGATGSVYCNICNKELSGSKVIPKKQHEYTSTVLRTATCVKTGCVRHTCKFCKSSYDEETPIDPDNHTGIVTANGKEATYESEGLTKGEMCKACGKVLKEQTVIPKLEREESVTEPDAPSTEPETEPAVAPIPVHAPVLTAQIQNAPAEEDTGWTGTQGDVPAVKGIKAKAKGAKVTVSWKKAARKQAGKFDSVEIQICTDRNFDRSNTVSKEVGKGKKSAAFKGLAKKTTYYVRARNVSGSGDSRVVSGWSKVKKVKTK